MGFWLDMVFGKSPLQSELDALHAKVESGLRSDREVLVQLTDGAEAQVEFNKNVHEALEVIAECNTDKSEFALRTVEEIDRIRARLDLLEANVVVHKRVKMKPVKGGVTIKNYKLDDPIPEGLIQPTDFRRDDT